MLLPRKNAETGLRLLQFQHNITEYSTQGKPFGPGFRTSAFLIPFSSNTVRSAPLGILAEGTRDVVLRRKGFLVLSSASTAESNGTIGIASGLSC